MSSYLYKENRNLINMIRAELEKIEKKRRSFNKGVNVYFKNDLSLRLDIEVIPFKRVTLSEDGRGKFYFLETFKAGAVMLGGEDIRSITNEDEIATKAFVSTLSKYSTNHIEAESIFMVLKQNGYTQFDGVGDKYELSYYEDNNGNLSDRLYQDFIVRVKRSMRDGDYKYLKGCPEIDSYKKIIEDLSNATYTVITHPDMFKSLKERDSVPLAFLEGNTLNVPSKDARSRARKGGLSRLFNQVNIQDSLGDIKNSIRISASADPYSKWIYIQIDNLPSLNKKSYDLYNFDIK